MTQEIVITGQQEMTEVEILKAKIAELEIKLAQNAINNDSSESKASKKAKEFVLTPYQATKIMNEQRRALGLKEINSPMLYIYARKNAFIISTSADGRKVVDEESFLKWMNEHNEKQSKAAKK